VGGWAPSSRTTHGQMWLDWWRCAGARMGITHFLACRLIVENFPVAFKHTFSIDAGLPSSFAIRPCVVIHGIQPIAIVIVPCTLAITILQILPPSPPANSRPSRLLTTTSVGACSPTWVDLPPCNHEPGRLLTLLSQCCAPAGAQQLGLSPCTLYGVPESEHARRLPHLRRCQGKNCTGRFAVHEMQ